MERKQFKTEVSELLQLIIHSLYSHKEIFLRELQKLCPGMEIVRSGLGEKANIMAAAEVALDKWVYLTSMLESMRSWL